jgi:trehalose synthase
VLELLEDPERATALGAAAHERVREHFLGDRHLKQYGEIFSRILVRRRIRRDAR